jgi:hypothetical protein
MELNSYSECMPGSDGGVCVPPDIVKKLAKKVKINPEIINEPSAISAERKQTRIISGNFGDMSTNALAANAPIDPKEIIEQAKEVTGCDSESCTIRRLLPGREADAILQTYFKPSGPGTGEQLLSNFNIDDVLVQYSKTHPEFMHIPFQMIDFDSVGSELSKIKLHTLIKNHIKYAGCVINTDITAPGHNGIHWFALFIDLSRAGTNNDPYTIEYFNSSGRLPVEEIQIFARRLQQELTEYMPNSHCEFVIASRVQHQRDKHSCGPYALYYIISRLNGVPYTWFQKNVVTDDRMHEFRRHLFRIVE